MATAPPCCSSFFLNLMLRATHQVPSVFLFLMCADPVPAELQPTHRHSFFVNFVLWSSPLRWSNGFPLGGRGRCSGFGDFGSNCWDFVQNISAVYGPETKYNQMTSQHNNWTTDPQAFLHSSLHFYKGDTIKRRTLNPRFKRGISNSPMMPNLVPSENWAWVSYILGLTAPTNGSDQRMPSS